MVDILLKRRSCRQFHRDVLPPKSDLDKILAAGLAYPCAHGNQELEFLVISNRALLDRLGDRVAALCTPFKDYLAQRQARYGFCEPVWCDAPIVIFANFKGPKGPGTYYEVNGGAAILNVIAAAEELGYATLPVLMASGPPQNAAASEILGVPADQLGLSVGIGKALDSWKPDPKEQISQVIWVK
jgi:nitroreductase